MMEGDRIAALEAALAQIKETPYECTQVTGCVCAQLKSIARAALEGKERRIMTDVPTWPCVVCGGPVAVNERDALPSEGSVYGGFIHFGCEPDTKNRSGKEQS